MSFLAWRSKSSLLRDAARKGESSTVAKLLESSKLSDINEVGWSGNTALMWASQGGRAEAVKLLITAGADVHVLNKDGWTALMWASENGKGEVVKLLLAEGAQTHVQNKDMRTALMLASAKGHAVVVALLVAAGADKNLQDKSGNTALMMASANAHDDVVRLLVEERTDLHLFNEDGWTALLWASDEGHLEVVKILVAAGADKNVQDKDGGTALMLASQAGHTEVVKLLIAAGADKTLLDKDGWTTLMQAAWNGHAEVVKLLLAAGTDLHVQDETGYTALMIASFNSHPEVVRLLMTAGAQRHVRNYDGKSAHDLAATKEIKVLLTANYDSPTSEAQLPSRLNFASSDLAGLDYVIKAATSPPTPVFSAADHLPASPRLPSADATAAQSAFAALQSECELLLTQAAEATQRRNLAVRAESIVTRLTAAKEARDFSLIAAARREQAALGEELGVLTLSEEECRLVPDKIRNLEDRLFDFSLECDVDAVDRVAELQLLLHQSLDALTVSPDPSLSPQKEETVPPPTPHRESAGAVYFTGSVLIQDVKPAFEFSAGSTGAPSARTILRGRFETRDELNDVRQRVCVIKCAAQSSTDAPSADSTAAMRREHEMYLEVQRRAQGGLSGCVRLFSAHPLHHYLVLEDHGTDLRALLNPKLRYPQHVLEAVVSAVQALHSLNIMHGDIKPQNILCKWIDHDYVVKLCDLDSACEVGETCRAASLGTKHYHAPEVRVAARSGLTIAASLELDMFPLGLVLWQLLARSPHPVLDCAEEEELYTSQEKLDEHLNLASFYKPALQKVTCINPKQRMTIVDLYRAAKTLNSASTAQQGWLQEKEANRQLKDSFGSQLSAMDEKLDKMSAKLDTVLQELRTRFDALGSTAMEVAESLRKEIILGGQQAHVLPDVIQATQDALQRLSDAVDKTDQTQRNPGTSITELQDCMSSMQASIATAISRALAEQKKEDAGEFYAVAAQLQSQVSSLSTELQACLREQRQSSAHTAQQLDVLSHTSTCLQLGLKDVLSSLVEVQSELAELKKNQILLGKQMEESLASHADLNAMVRALAVNTHGVPTLAIILPVVSSSWKSTFSPMRLVRDQYRLYFLCSHTHQIAPCGPKGKGKGYKITMTKQWVLDAAPVLRVGLVLVKVALLASGLPLPVPDLCSALAEKGMHAQYLNAALHVVSNPPDAALTSAEYTMQHTLDAIDEHDYSEYKDAGAEARLQEGSRKAYEAIKEILGRDGVNIPLTCGLRQVTHRGKIAWVLDNDSAEKDWRDAVDASVLRGASV